jgi:hypothetical protein
MDAEHISRLLLLEEDTRFIKSLTDFLLSLDRPKPSPSPLSRNFSDIAQMPAPQYASQEKTIAGLYVCLTNILNIFRELRTLEYSKTEFTKQRPLPIYEIPRDPLTSADEGNPFLPVSACILNIKTAEEIRAELDELMRLSPEEYAKMLDATPRKSREGMRRISRFVEGRDLPFSKVDSLAETLEETNKVLLAVDPKVIQGAFMHFRKLMGPAFKVDEANKFLRALSLPRLKPSRGQKPEPQ